MIDTSSERIKRIAADLYGFANAERRAEAADLLLALQTRVETAEKELRELTEPISDAGHMVADGFRAEIEQWRGLAERRGRALLFLLTTIAEATDETKKRLLNDSPPGRDVCFARQFSDRMRCFTCDLSWDVNDSDPPKCDPQLMGFREGFGR